MTETDTPIRIIHIITGLERGGAEHVLHQVLAGMDSASFLNKVISLTAIGPIGEEIAALGIPVEAAGLQEPRSSLSGFLATCRAIRRYRPHIVQTWMYHGDLIGGLAARVGTRSPVVWNLRQSNLDPVASKASTIFIRNMCARLSTVIPREIVCGSFAARTVHAEKGYDETRMVVLPNGFDSRRFRSVTPDARQAARRQFGVDGDAFIIGLAARYHAQKDHDTFCRAVSLAVQRHPNVQALLVGHDITSDNASLVRLLDDCGIIAVTHLAGPLADMESFYQAIDGLVMSSAFGEGAPNVVGEAMTCGVPCVVTDVGDCAEMVGETGLVAPPKSPRRLADAIQTLAEMTPDSRKALGEAARRRIDTVYPHWVMISRYELLYRRIYAQRFAGEVAEDGRMRLSGG